jgi:hypothetical protein
MHIKTCNGEEKEMSLKILKPQLYVFVQYALQLESTATQHGARREKSSITADHESFRDALPLWLYLPVDASFVVQPQPGKHPVMKHLLDLVPRFTIDVHTDACRKNIEGELYAA